MSVAAGGKSKLLCLAKEPKADKEKKREKLDRPAGNYAVLAFRCENSLSAQW